MRIVKNGDVHVSVPIGMSKKEVEAFITQHQEWIVEARKKTAERQKQRTDFFHQLPLTTRAQKMEATERVRKLVEPMIDAAVSRREASFCRAPFPLRIARTSPEFP